MALKAALPVGYSFKEGNVASTRVYKCPTRRRQSRRCRGEMSDDSARELKIMRPRVVLAMGADVWAELFQYLHIGGEQRSKEPRRFDGTVDGRVLPVVACYHLTRTSNIYRSKVRSLLCEALGIG